MPIAIFALAAINFAVGTQGFAFAGLLPELAAALGITVGQAGWLLAATSITFAVTSPLAARLVARVERRRVIAWSLAGLTLLNAACVFAPDFAALFALRALTGLATAFSGAMASVAAASLVPAEKRGRAFAIVVGGLTVAFVLGVPLGSAVGGAYGWRAIFGFSAAVSLLSLALVLALVPRVPAAASVTARIGDVLAESVLLRLLTVTLVGFSATFTVVAFIGPIITWATGATGAGVGAMQAFIGLGSIIGLIAGGLAADRQQSRSALLAAFGVMALSLPVYWLVLTAPRGVTPPWAMALLIVAGASALFSLVPVVLAELSRAAGPATPMALALNGSLVSLGQGLGALLGGVLTDAFGQAAVAWGGAGLALAGLALAAALPPNKAAGERRVAVC